ncbi:hypothetical protein ACIGXI_09095 [Kitasatospora aureofaciens]|uniref:hypothetical protein n=1 Tax=Kitasatospora aureofaciens TaxID=1894 RepID=UPI0037CADC72
MGDLKVDPGEIYISAGMARAIAEDFAKPCQAVATASQTAVSGLMGWSVATRLGQVAGGWAPVLAGVSDRLKKTADNLTATAQAYSNNEHANVDVWRNHKIGEAWEKPGQ